jgi:hypothetical protein
VEHRPTAGVHNRHIPPSNPRRCDGTAERGFSPSAPATATHLQSLRPRHPARFDDKSLGEPEAEQHAAWQLLLELNSNHDSISANGNQSVWASPWVTLPSKACNQAEVTTNRKNENTSCNRKNESNAAKLLWPH